jgi:hypothetical protein
MALPRRLSEAICYRIHLSLVGGQLGALRGLGDEADLPWCAKIQAIVSTLEPETSTQKSSNTAPQPR